MLKSACGNTPGFVSRDRIVSLAGWHRPAGRLLTRIIALLIAVTFVFPYLAFAFEAGSYPKPVNEISFQQRPVRISTSLGTVSGVFQGGAETVVYVQDLHCNYEVQNNIARLIDRLAAEHGLRLVTVEGTAQTIDVSPLAQFPLAEAKKLAADYLLKEGKITGPELYAVTGRHPIRLEGIEKTELYQANRAAVLKFLNDESQGYVFDLRESLDRVKPAVYNQALAQLDRKRSQYREGELPLLKYGAYLAERARRGGLELRTYPNLVLYLTTGRDDLHEAVDSDGLFQELDRLDRALRAPLYTASEQRELDALDHRLDVMEKLLNISAAPEELAEFRGHREKFTVGTVREFIAKHEAAGDSMPGADVRMLDSYLEDAAGFYRAADQRSLSFVDNLQKQMRTHKTDLALLVTGGFHAAEVQAELRRRNISYVCVKPRLTRQDVVNPYFSILMNRKTSLEKLLARNQNIFAPESGFVTKSLDAVLGAAQAIATIAVWVKRGSGLTVENARKFIADSLGADWTSRLSFEVTAVNRLGDIKLIGVAVKGAVLSLVFTAKTKLPRDVNAINLKMGDQAIAVNPLPAEKVMASLRGLMNHAFDAARIIQTLSLFAAPGLLKNETGSITNPGMARAGEWLREHKRLVVLLGAGMFIANAACLTGGYLEIIPAYLPYAAAAALAALGAALVAVPRFFRPDERTLREGTAGESGAMKMRITRNVNLVSEKSGKQPDFGRIVVVEGGYQPSLLPHIKAAGGVVYEGEQPELRRLLETMGVPFVQLEPGNAWLHAMKLRGIQFRTLTLDSEAGRIYKGYPPNNARNEGAREKALSLLRDMDVSIVGAKRATDDELITVNEYFKILPEAHIEKLKKLRYIYKLPMLGGFVVGLPWIKRHIFLIRDSGVTYGDVAVHELGHVIENQMKAASFYSLSWPRALRYFLRGSKSILNLSLFFFFQNLPAIIASLVGIIFILTGYSPDFLATGINLLVHYISATAATLPLGMKSLLMILPMFYLVGKVNGAIAGLVFRWKNAAFVSRYGRVTHNEDFAETYRMYVLYGPEFRRMAEENLAIRAKYLWMQKELFEDMEYTRDARDKVVPLAEPSRIVRDMNPEGAPAVSEDAREKKNARYDDSERGAFYGPGEMLNRIGGAILGALPQEQGPKIYDARREGIETESGANRYAVTAERLAEAGVTHAVVSVDHADVVDQVYELLRQNIVPTVIHADPKLFPDQWARIEEALGALVERVAAMEAAPEDWNVPKTLYHQKAGYVIGKTLEMARLKTRLRAIEGAIGQLEPGSELTSYLNAKKDDLKRTISGLSLEIKAIEKEHAAQLTDEAAVRIYRRNLKSVYLMRAQNDEYLRADLSTLSEHEASLARMTASARRLRLSAGDNEKIAALADETIKNVNEINQDIDHIIRYEGLPISLIEYEQQAKRNLLGHLGERGAVVNPGAGTLLRQAAGLKFARPGWLKRLAGAGAFLATVILTMPAAYAETGNAAWDLAARIALEQNTYLLALIVAAALGLYRAARRYLPDKPAKTDLRSRRDKSFSGPGSLLISLLKAWHDRQNREIAGAVIPLVLAFTTFILGAYWNLYLFIPMMVFLIDFLVAVSRGSSRAWSALKTGSSFLFLLGAAFSALADPALALSWIVLAALAFDVKGSIKKDNVRKLGKVMAVFSVLLLPGRILPESKPETGAAKESTQPQTGLDELDADAVLFDMDGTLVDSMPMQAEAWYLALKQFGLAAETERETVKRYFLATEGIGAEQIVGKFICGQVRPQLQAAIEGNPDEAVPACHRALLTVGAVAEGDLAGVHRAVADAGRNADEVVRLVLEQSRGRELVQEIRLTAFAEFDRMGPVPLLAGAGETIEKLAAQGKKLALVTTAPSQVLHKNRIPADLLERFTVIVAGNDVNGEKKPAPTPYLMALAKLGIPADRAVVVENSELGVQSAQAAGIRCLAVQNTQNEAQLSGSNRSFKNTRALFEYLVKPVADASAEIKRRLFELNVPYLRPAPRWFKLFPAAFILISAFAFQLSAPKADAAAHAEIPRHVREQVITRFYRTAAEVRREAALEGKDIYALDIRPVPQGASLVKRLTGYLDNRETPTGIYLPERVLRALITDPDNRRAQAYLDRIVWNLGEQYYRDTRAGVDALREEEDEAVEAVLAAKEARSWKGYLDLKSGKTVNLLPGQIAQLLVYYQKTYRREDMRGIAADLNRWVQAYRDREGAVPDLDSLLAILKSGEADPGDPNFDLLRAMTEQALDLKGDAREAAIAAVLANINAIVSEQTAPAFTQRTTTNSVRIVRPSAIDAEGMIAKLEAEAGAGEGERLRLALLDALKVMSGEQPKLLAADSGAVLASALTELPQYEYCELGTELGAVNHGAVHLGVAEKEIEINGETIRVAGDVLLTAESKRTKNGRDILNAAKDLRISKLDTSRSLSLKRYRHQEAPPKLEDRLPVFLAETLWAAAGVMPARARAMIRTRLLPGMWPAWNLQRAVNGVKSQVRAEAEAQAQSDTGFGPAGLAKFLLTSGLARMLPGFEAKAVSGLDAVDADFNPADIEKIRMFVNQDRYLSQAYRHWIISRTPKTRMKFYRAMVAKIESEAKREVGPEAMTRNLVLLSIFTRALYGEDGVIKVAAMNDSGRETAFWDIAALENCGWTAENASEFYVPRELLEGRGLGLNRTFGYLVDILRRGPFDIDERTEDRFKTRVNRGFGASA